MIKANDIHLIQTDSGYVVFLTESLSLFVVTEDIGKILKAYEINSKYITSDVAGVINNILNDLSGKIKLNSTENIKWINSEPRSLNLLISQDCNLKCEYCYADHGTYGYEKKLMSYETAKKCIDKLLSKESNNYIVFIGGEPLLNFPLIKQIDFYLNNQNMSAKYTAVTNGTLMNSNIKNFINEKFLELWISLDGPKYINDEQRYGLPESVHDRVVETIETLHPRRYPIIIKSIITKRSAGKLAEIIEHISSLKIDCIDIKPVKDASPESEFFASDEDYNTYINELANILASNIKKLANGEEVKLMTYIYPILMQMISKTRKINGCAASRELITIAADGDVYPCPKYIGLKEFHMGNVHDEDFPGERFKMFIEIFNNINVNNSPDCSICWARFLCGGVCHWESYVTHGDMSRPIERYCLETKSILEALLPEIAEIFSDEVKTKNVLNYLKLNNQNKVLTTESQY